MFVGDRGKGNLLPALAERETAVVKIAAGASLGETDHRHIVHRRLTAIGDQSDKGIELGGGRLQRFGDRNSVDGQRGRPSGVTRLDLLNVVGSRPAFLARPDGVNLARAASRSIAVQI